MLPEHSPSQSGPPKRLSARALACHIAGERMMAAFARFQALAEKAGFNPDQPRVPAGNPDGGQWTGSGGATGSRQPGIGDNGGPPLDPPEPPKEPSKDKARGCRPPRRWRSGSHSGYCGEPANRCFDHGCRTRRAPLCDTLDHVLSGCTEDARLTPAECRQEALGL